MLDSLPFSLLIGCILGFLSGLGVGGGSLLMLWLTIVLDIEHDIARSINLLFFIPAAILSTIFRKKSGHLHIKKVIPAIMAGCFSAAIASVISQHLDTTIIQKTFGFLLIATAIRELTYKPKIK